MLYVACPSCGERGKIPPTLVGARIKCKKCGISFNVAPSAAKVPAVEGTAVAAGQATAQASGTAEGGIAVDGLEASAWAVSSDQPPDLLKAEADAGLSESAEATHAFEAPNSTGFKEYKVLWSRDKLFEGKFDVARLEEALNYFARQGWVVNALPPLKVVQFLGNACLSPTTLAPKDPFRSCGPQWILWFSLFSEEPHWVIPNEPVGKLGGGPTPRRGGEASRMVGDCLTTLPLG